MLDLRDLKQADIDTLLALGVSPSAIIYPYTPQTCRGVVYRGFFEETASGPTWFAFGGLNDIILWEPQSGKLVSDWNNAFALGEEVIDHPGATFDGWLRVFADPADWLRHERQGIVVIDWRRAFEWLHYVPGVAVDPRLVSIYRRSMKPPLPKLAVIPQKIERKAA